MVVSMLSNSERSSRGLSREDARCLVMKATGRAFRIHSRHDVGPNQANQAHVVADDLVAPPLLHRLFDAERVAEVDGTREVLLGAIEPMHRRQFFGAED